MKINTLSSLILPTLLTILLLGLLLPVAAGANPLLTSPLPAATQPSSPLPTATDPPTASPTLTVEPTVTLSSTMTATVTPTLIPTLTATAAATPTVSPTLTVTPTVTPTVTVTGTTQPTITPTLSSTVTPTVTVTPSVSATVQPTATPTLTATLMPTLTATIQPTTTATATPPPTATIQPAPTATPTPRTTLTPAATPTRPVPTPRPSPTPTPTASGPISPLPTPPSSPTATATAPSSCADAFEPNDALTEGPPLLLNQVVEPLTLWPLGDVDTFALWVKAERHYQLSTRTETIDTRLRLRDSAGQLLVENDDVQPGQPASQLQFRALGEGWLYIVVDSASPLDWGCLTYGLIVTELAEPSPTATASPTITVTPEPTLTPGPTLTPTATPEQWYDAYEPNYDIDHAADLGVGQTVRLNFNPWPAGHPGPDNDFFRFYVKAGQRLRFETTDLAPGLDTNLILFAENGTVIAGNDDCTPAERRSCLDWTVDTTGYRFLLIGPVGLTPKAVSAEASAYTLRVSDMTAPSPTPNGPIATSTPVYGEPLPWSPAPPPGFTPAAPITPVAISPLPTPTPAVRPVQVRPFSLLPPTPTIVPPEPLSIELTLYHDANDNKAPDLEEGVSGVSVRVLDPLTNRLLGQTVTDAQGYAQLRLSAGAEVQLSVAYLGYSQTIRPPGKPVQIRLPALQLPSLIP